MRIIRGWWQIWYKYRGIRFWQIKRDWRKPFCAHSEFDFSYDIDQYDVRTCSWCESLFLARR